MTDASWAQNLISQVLSGSCPASQGRRASCREGWALFERLDAWERVALKQRQESPARRRYEAKFVGELHVVDRRIRVSAPNNRQGMRVRDRFAHVVGAARKILVLVRPHRAVPDDGLRGVQRLLKEEARCRSHIERHSVSRDLLNWDGSTKPLTVEVRRNNYVDWQVHLAVAPRQGLARA